MTWEDLHILDKSLLIIDQVPAETAGESERTMYKLSQDINSLIGQRGSKEQSLSSENAEWDYTAYTTYHFNSTKLVKKQPTGFKQLTFEVVSNSLINNFCAFWFYEHRLLSCISNYGESPLFSWPLVNCYKTLNSNTLFTTTKINIQCFLVLNFNVKKNIARSKPTLC